MLYRGLMNFRWTMRRLHRWGISRRKLRGGFLHTRLGDRVLERELWFPSRESLAKAWLIGMPVTVIPFLPLQTVIACGFGFYFRANLPVCFILQYLSNPATAIFQLSACYFVGRLLFGESPTVIVHHVEHIVNAFAAAKSWEDYISDISGKEFVALYLGGIVLGFALGLMGYGLTHLIWRENPRRKPKPPHIALMHTHDERVHEHTHHPLHEQEQEAGLTPNQETSQNQGAGTKPGPGQEPTQEEGEALKAREASPAPEARAPQSPPPQA